MRDLVAERLGVPAEVGQRGRAPHQDAARQHSLRHAQRAVELRHAPGGIPDQRQRQAETGPDVSLTLGLAAGLGRMQGTA